MLSFTRILQQREYSLDAAATHRMAGCSGSYAAALVGTCGTMQLLPWSPSASVVKGPVMLELSYQSRDSTGMFAGHAFCCSGSLGYSDTCVLTVELVFYIEMP